MALDLDTHAGDREDRGQVGLEPAEFQRPTIGGLAPAMGLIGEDDHPARQSFDSVEVEHDPRVPRLDQVEQIRRQLPDLRLLDQGPVDQADDGDPPLVRDAEARPIGNRGLGVALAPTGRGAAA